MQAARSLFYFPQNAIYFISVSFSGQIIRMFFIKSAPKFEYQPWLAKVNVHLYMTGGGYEVGSAKEFILHIEDLRESDYPKLQSPR
jgi:hypothetical protein